MCSIVVSSSPIVGYTCGHCKGFVPAGQWHNCPIGFSSTVNGHTCPKCGAFVLNHAFHSCGGSMPSAATVAEPTPAQLASIIEALRRYHGDTTGALAWAEALRASR